MVQFLHFARGNLRLKSLTSTESSTMKAVCLLCICGAWIVAFAGVILFKTPGDGSKKIKGCCDLIHVVEMQSSRRDAHYMLTSTVLEVSIIMIIPTIIMIFFFF